MRLSEAILLGDSLKKATNNLYLIQEEGGCLGCAIGGAVIAAGLAAQYFAAKENPDGSYRCGQAGYHNDAFRGFWPWFIEEHGIKISAMYADVLAGEKTIEQIADYVRSIEPPEPTEAESQPEEIAEKVCR